MIELLQFYFRSIAINGLLYLICLASALSATVCLYRAVRGIRKNRPTLRARWLLVAAAFLGIPAVMLVASWLGVDTIPVFFKMPLVVGGISGGEYDSDGTSYFTIDGEPEFVSANAPIVRVAHVAIIPDPAVNLQATGSDQGNAADKFVFRGRYEYSINGKPFAIELKIDGRARTFTVGEKSFKLARGNYFRIRISPGPVVHADQLPVTDTVDSDPIRVKAVFTSHP
jgi:hypothetical protein